MKRVQKLRESVEVAEPFVATDGLVHVARIATKSSPILSRRESETISVASAVYAPLIFCGIDVVWRFCLHRKRAKK